MKKVLIIGAGFLQNFVIKKAKSLGYYTIAVDGDKNAIGFQYADKFATIDIVDKEFCLQFAIENNIDGVLTAATDFGVLTTSYIADKMGLPGLKFETAKKIKNKYLVRKCLYENKVDDTEQAFEVDDSTDIEELSKTLHYPVMVKPCDGSGSRGASRVDKPENLEQACKYAKEGSITHRAEIETFIEGNEYGVESLVADGNIHVLGVMKKWMTAPPYYAELGHAIPSGLTKELESKIIMCVQKAIKALEINFGSVNMDLLVTKDGKVYIVDIGARMGGNMIGPCIIPYGTGFDYVTAMIQNAVGDSVNWSVNEHKAVASKLLAFEEGVVKKLPDFKQLEKEYDVEIYHHMCVGELVNEYHTNLDGCGYIIAKADNVEEAEKRAEEVFRKIKEYSF